MSYTVTPSSSSSFYRSTAFVLGLTLAFTCLGLSEAFAIDNDASLKEQITNVDKTFKSIVNVALWLVVIGTGAMGVYKQSFPTIGIAAGGGVVLHQLSSWITATFTLTL